MIHRDNQENIANIASETAVPKKSGTDENRKENLFSAIENEEENPHSLLRGIPYAVKQNTTIEPKILDTEVTDENRKENLFSANGNEGKNPHSLLTGIPQNTNKTQGLLVAYIVIVNQKSTFPMILFKGLGFHFLIPLAIVVQLPSVILHIINSPLAALGHRWQMDST